MSEQHTAENGLPACGSCGAPAPYTITLRGEPTPACLRHLNVWRDPVVTECPDCGQVGRYDRRVIVSGRGVYTCPSGHRWQDANETPDSKGYTVIPPAVCRCDCAYVGAQPAGTPVRCERCGGLVDEVASERMEAVYAESRRRLEERAATRPIPPAVTEEGGR